MTAITREELEASDGSSIIGFINDGTGGVLRTVEGKLREVVSVLDFIPAAEHAAIKARSSTTDVTAYIQAAIDAVIAAGGGELRVPSGTYKTTDFLDISDARLCNLRGEGKEMSIIARANTDGPILCLTNASSSGMGNGYSWSWEGLALVFSSPAGTSDTDAVGISFETGGGDETYGYVNFLWRDIQIVGAHTAISNDYGAGDPPNVWGFNWTGLAISDFADRALHLTNVGTGGGFPNSAISSLYVQGRSGITYTDSIGYIDACDGLVVSNLEYNIGAFSTPNGMFHFQGRAINVVGARFETVSFSETEVEASDIQSLFLVESGPAINVIGLSAANITVNAGVTCYGVRIGTSTRLTLIGFDVSSIGGAGTMTACTGSNGQIELVTGVAPNAGSWISGNGGYYNAVVQPQTTGVAVLGSKVIGARDTGWTAGTGIANKGAFATYAGQNVSAGYVEAEAQATDDGVKAGSQRIKAIEDALRGHGLIN